MGKLRHQKSSNLPKVTYLQNATAEAQTLVVGLHVTTGYQKPGCVCVCVCVCWGGGSIIFMLQKRKPTLRDMK